MYYITQTQINFRYFNFIIDYPKGVLLFFLRMIRLKENVLKDVICFESYLRIYILEVMHIISNIETKNF